MNNNSFVKYPLFIDDTNSLTNEVFTMTTLLHIDASVRSAKNANPNHDSISKNKDPVKSTVPCQRYLSSEYFMKK